MPADTGLREEVWGASQQHLLTLSGQWDTEGVLFAGGCGCPRSRMRHSFGRVDVTLPGVPRVRPRGQWMVVQAEHTRGVLAFVATLSCHGDLQPPPIWSASSFAQYLVFWNLPRYGPGPGEEVL